MSVWYDIANEFKKRDNKTTLVASIGTITSVAPLKIKYNNDILLDGDDYYLTDYFNSLTKNIDDKVLLIANNDGQRFFIIDKVV